jgi:hypothetical protein
MMSETVIAPAAVQDFDSPIDRAMAKALRLEAAHAAAVYSNVRDRAAALVELAELYEDRAAVRDAAQREGQGNAKR